MTGIAFKNRHFFIWSVLALIFVFCCQCAQITAPSGGKKDVTPPRALKYVPKNEETNFSAKSIFITFNEFFILENPTEQIIISPILNPKPTFKTKGKSLIIDLKECVLQENTTYTIFFGESIKDLNEHNILSDFYYVFSTGNFVDSLVIRGGIYNAFDLLPQEKSFVTLYSCSNDTIPCDSLPYLIQPEYIAQTKANGTFILKNLANKSYRIFALKDQNRNFLFDPGEEIAFLDSLIIPAAIPNIDSLFHVDSLVSFSDSLGQSTKQDTLQDKVALHSHEHEYFIELFTFTEQDENIQVIKNTIIDSTHIMLVFSSFSEEISFSLLSPSLENVPDSMPWHIDSWTRAYDSVLIWFPYFINDSISFVVNHKNMALDTLNFSLKKEIIQTNKNKRNNEKIKTDSTVIFSKISHNGTGKIPFFSPLKLQFDVPVYLWTTDNVLFFTGNDTIALPSPPLITDSDFFTEAWFDYSFKEKTSYRMIIPENSFTDILGHYNDSITISFITDEPDIYGTLTFSLTIPENSPQLLLQLLSEKEQIMQQHIITESRKIDFGYLKPGKMLIKVICDDNKNGRWDSGNYLMHTQPEKVYYFNKTIEIRANWDIEEEWKIELL